MADAADTKGMVDMKVTNKKNTGFYVKSAKSFFQGVEGKDGEKKRTRLCSQHFWFG